MPSKTPKQHRVVSPSDADAAWAAGIHCGEGNVGVHRPRRYVGVRWTVAQTTSSETDPPEMLTRLRAIFGVGRLYRLHDGRRNRKPIWQFYLHNMVDIQACFAHMWPWLTPEKCAQAESAFQTYYQERHAFN